MNISTTVRTNAPTPATRPVQKTSTEPTESFSRSSEAPAPRLKQALGKTLAIGGVGLAGAALGAFAGSSSGILAGVAGAVVGLSAGATIGNATHSSPKAGAVLGALTGAVVSSSFGNPAAAVAMGLAGATVPVGLGIGVAEMLSV